MSGRYPTLLRRLLDRTVDGVSDRKSWLSGQLYRAVAAPLQRLDPAGGARAAEARLDDIRDRVIGMAARGIAPGEPGRIQRDLTRTRKDLERMGPRPPVVWTHVVTLRVDAYTEVLSTLSGAPVARSGRAQGRDAVILAAAAAATAMGLFLTAAGTAAVEGGLAAGLAAALGLTAVRRRARKERIQAIAGTLTKVDETIRTPNGVDVRVLDGERRALLTRALRSGRLDVRGAEALRRIDVHLDDLLIRLIDGDLEADASHLVQATITRYLPDTLEPFLTLTQPRVVVRGRPAAVEVANQLAWIESGLADAIRRPARHRPETLLLLQGEFLRSKFGDPSM